MIGELGAAEAMALIALPPPLIGEVLRARARYLTGERRDRLVDLAIAMHPGEKGRTLAKHSKALEKASRRPRRLRKGESQQDADAQTALKHLLG